MKNLFMVAIAAFGLMTVTSCGDNEDGPVTPQGTTCQITNNTTEPSTVGADGTMYDTKVIFYNGDTEISEVAVGSIANSGGMSDAIVAPAGATQARIAFLMLPATNTAPENVMQYTVDYFALTTGTLTSITITRETSLTSTKGAMKGTVMTFGEALAQL